MTGELTQFEQHTVQIQRLATKLLNSEIYPSLNEAYKAARLILLDAEEITSITQLNKITREINNAVTGVLSPAWAEATTGMDELAVYEAGYYANLITNSTAVALTVPANEKILSYINKSLMSLQSGKRTTSGTWAQLVKANTDSVVRDYNNAVMTSFAQGETVNQATKRIKDINEGLTKNEAEALARTGVQHYAVQSRQAMAEANKDVIDREVPSTIFDNRRTLICMGIQEQYGEKGWLLGQAPMGYPPYHYNCRTVILHLVKGQDSLEGRRTAIGGQSGKEAKEAYELRKERKRLSGKVTRRGGQDDKFFDPSQINSTTKIDNWFLSQPVWWQDSNVGKTRAALVRKGGMSFSKFTDMTGRQLNLDELRALDSKAFEMAGID